MAKEIKKKNKAVKSVKIKDLPEEEEEKDLTEEEAGKVEGELEEVQDDLADETADTEEKDLEPYSSQVLRRLHEDGSIMMKDYDEMNQILEHPEVKDYLTDHLTGLEKHLSAVEKLHGKHHKDLPPIVGADEDEEGDEGEKDLEDDEAVEADSGEKEEPTPEEVIEGMEKETKEFDPEEMKALRGKYKKKCMKTKDVCPECGKEGCTCGKKALTEDEAGKIEGELENVQDDLANETADTEAKGLEPHEKEKVGEAVSYLKDIGQEGSEFGDEHRMKAYHYSKALEDIGEMKSWHKGLKGIKGQPSEDISPEKARQILKDGTVHGKPLTDKQRGMFGAAAGRGKSVPGSPEWEKEEANEPEHKDFAPMDAQEEEVEVTNAEKSLHPHRKMCKNASGFFKALAFEKAFGDNHRAEAIKHAGNLGSIMEETYEPGEMGQKSSTGNVGDEVFVLEGPGEGSEGVVLQKLGNGKVKVKLDTGQVLDLDERALDYFEDVKGLGKKRTKALKNIYLKQNKEIEELAKKFSRLAKV